MLYLKYKTDRLNRVCSFNVNSRIKQSFYPCNDQDVSVDLNESLMLIYLIAGPKPFRKWAIPEKSKQEELRTYLFEKHPMEFLDLSFYPRKF